MSTPINLPARIEERKNGLFDVIARVSGENIELGVEIHDFDQAATIARDFNRHSIPSGQFAVAAQDNDRAVITFGGVPVAVLAVSEPETFHDGEPRAAFVVRGVEVADGILKPTVSSGRVASSVALRVAFDATLDDVMSASRA